MSDATGRGDVDKVLPLLWRHSIPEASGARGPRPRFSVDDVVTAAIGIADADGLASVTIRQVAERLGTKPMSLYTYVPGKNELIDLMVDQVSGEVELTPLTGTTRQKLERIARVSFDELRAHPWLLHIDSSRPPLGPNVSDRWEWALSAVDGIGIDEIEMDQIITLVLGFTKTPARDANDADRANSDSGETDVEWWERNAPVLETIMDESRYPISGRVGTVTGEAYQSAANPALAFEFGLARVLDGIESYLRANAPG